MKTSMIACLSLQLHFPLFKLKTKSSLFSKFEQFHQIKSFQTKRSTVSTNASDHSVFETWRCLYAWCKHLLWHEKRLGLCKTCSQMRLNASVIACLIDRYVSCCLSLQPRVFYCYMSQALFCFPHKSIMFCRPCCTNPHNSRALWEPGKQ